MSLYILPSEKAHNALDYVYIEWANNLPGKFTR